MDPLRRFGRILAVGALVGGLTGFVPVLAQSPGQGVGQVQPAFRDPHIFYEPQVLYPPLGAQEVVRSSFPGALLAAAIVFAGLAWITRPLAGGTPTAAPREPSELVSSPAAPSPPSGARPSQAPPGPATARPAVVEAPPGPSVEPAVAQVRLEAAPPALPSPPRRDRLALASPPQEERSLRRPSPPLESPIVRFSWPGEERAMPLLPSHRVSPGLIACLTEPARAEELEVALVVRLLLEGSGPVLMLGGRAGPEGVVEGLLRARGQAAALAPGGPSSMEPARWALQAVTARLLLDEGWGLTPEGLLRAVARLGAGRRPPDGVVVGGAARLAMPGGWRWGPWLEDMHAVAGQVGVPLYLVAGRGELPLPAPTDRPWLGAGFMLEGEGRGERVWPPVDDPERASGRGAASGAGGEAC